MKSLLNIILFLFANFIGVSQTVLYESRFYSQADGIASYNVNSISEDKYGYMWIGTQDGLSFFDGIRFKNFNKYNTPLFSGSDINSLVYDSLNNFIWTAFSYGGISAVNCKTHKVNFKLSTENLKLAAENTAINNLSLSLENHLIISSDKSCVLYDFRAAKIKQLLQPKDFPSQNSFIVAVSDDKMNYYCFLYNYGVIVISKKTFQRKYLPASNYFSGYFSSKYSPQIVRTEKAIYFSAENGLYSIDYSLKIKLLIKTMEPITSFALGQKGKFWCATKSEIFVFDKESKVKTIVKFSKTSNDDKGQFYLCIFFDQKNNVWIGGSEGMIYSKLQAPIFTKYVDKKEPQKKISHVYNILLAKNRIYLNDIEGLKSINIENNEISNIDLRSFPYYIFETPQKNIVFNNERGLFFVDNNKLDSISIYHKFPELKKIRNRLLACHIQLNDSVIVFGSEDQKGLIFWYLKLHQVEEILPDIKNGWRDKVINMVYKINDSAILMCQDKCISVFNVKNKRCHNFLLFDNKIKDTARLYFDVLKYGHEFIFGSYGSGIFITDSLFKVKKIINTSNGLSNNGIYRILLDKYNYLWVSTNNGLNRINLSDYKCVSYFEKDGLASSSFEEMSAFANNDELYFGGLNGITKINPSNIVFDSKQPTLLFNESEYTFKNFDSTATVVGNGILKIPSNCLEFTLRFTTQNYLRKEKVAYQYRIAENDNTWLDLENVNFVSFIGLNPNTYHLQVRAANEDGVWGAYTEIGLEFLPKWYQTWWFKLLIISIASGVIYAFYRYRINQIKKQHEIRKNIATDLHDDLGSTLNSVKVFTNLAISGVKQEESLQQIKDNLTEATSGLRDMIWVLDDSLDTVDELVTRLKQFAIPVAAASNIEANITCDTDINSRHLTKEEKRNLFLICKEAINNSIKYSGATQINVVIKPESKKVRITIADNGKGFNQDEVKKGYGLKNMQYRAWQIKFKIELTSKPNVGTQINILPA